MKRAVFLTAALTIAGACPSAVPPTQDRYEVWIATTDGGLGKIEGCTTTPGGVEVVHGANQPAIVLHLDCGPLMSDGFE